jgi:hypothetical protein
MARPARSGRPGRAARGPPARPRQRPAQSRRPGFEPRLGQAEPAKASSRANASRRIFGRERFRYEKNSGRELTASRETQAGRLRSPPGRATAADKPAVTPRDSIPAFLEAWNRTGWRPGAGPPAGVPRRPHCRAAKAGGQTRRGDPGVARRLAVETRRPRLLRRQALKTASAPRLGARPRLAPCQRLPTVTPGARRTAYFIKVHCWARLSPGSESARIRNPRGCIIAEPPMVTAFGRAGTRAGAITRMQRPCIR